MNPDEQQRKRTVRIAAIAVATTAGAIVMLLAAIELLQEDQSIAGVNNAEVASQFEEQIGKTVFGPDVRLKQTFQEQGEVTIWARIEAEDPHGITVDGLEKDDEVIVESISGVAWFSGKAGWDRAVSAIVGVTQNVVDPTNWGKAAAEVVKNLAGRTGNDEEDPGRGTPRDGWGKDPDGDYAKNEGGIIVCMPQSHGPVYANDDNHLDGDAQSAGRFKEHIVNDSGLKHNCFFPTRFNETGNTADQELQGKATEAGVLHILA